MSKFGNQLARFDQSEVRDRRKRKWDRTGDEPKDNFFYCKCWLSMISLSGKCDEDHKREDDDEKVKNDLANHAIRVVVGTQTISHTITHKLLWKVGPSITYRAAIVIGDN